MKPHKILVIDSGIHTEHACKLGELGHKVYYWSEWREAFPTKKKMLVGEGLNGIERIQHWEDYKEKVDCVVIFDTHFGSMAIDLRNQGIPVFNAGASEILELDRAESRHIQKSIGLPTQDTEIITGIDKLRMYLKSVEDKWVKMNITRGDLDTFYHKNYISSESLLDDLAAILGMAKNTEEFIIEENVKGCEPGYDGFCIDGKFPKWGLWGWEKKSAGECDIVKTCLYEQIPEPIKLVNDKFAPVMKKLGARTMFSTEVIVNKKRQGYPIDLCMRAGMPIPTSIEMEIFEGFDDVIIKGANGDLGELKPKAKYGIGVCLDCEWAMNHRVYIDIPKDIKQWVKLMSACKIDNKYYALPGMSSVCSVIAIGNSIDECIGLVDERISEIDAYGMSKSSALSKVKESILKDSKEYGLPF